MSIKPRAPWFHGRVGRLPGVGRVLNTTLTIQEGCEHVREGTEGWFCATLVKSDRADGYYENVTVWCQACFMKLTKDTQEIGE